MPEIGDKIHVKVAGEYTWAEVTHIDTKVFTYPMYVGKVLHGLFKGYVVASPSYLDHAKKGQFISHELPEACNN